MILIFMSYFFVFFTYDKLNYIGDNIPIIMLTCAIWFAVYAAFKIYLRWWPYSNIRDYVELLVASAVALFATISIISFIIPHTLLIREYIVVNIFICISLISIRMLSRVIYKFIKYTECHKMKSSTGRRAIIYGAGGGGLRFVKEAAMEKDFPWDIVGFIDDDKNKKRLSIAGYKVLGTGDELEQICKMYHIKSILMAIPSADTAVKNRILNLCSDTGCEVKILPSLNEILEGKNILQVKSIEIDDLLSRDPIKLDNRELNHLINQKTIAVTGGGGSIGSELCRQISKYNPKQLIIIDIYENNAYDLQNELKSEYPNLNLEVLIASVRDKRRIDDIFSTYHPDIIFHAAAHKHVPLMEDSPSEAIKNNVFGTYNVARSAIEHDISRFVMISTDKAVNPTNVMGATKRICEMIVQSMQGRGKTEFVAVRFGNVLGSNGSVIPLFKRQIEHGGPVTLTDKRIIRYFMTIPEAAQLVLVAAGYAKGGEIFVLDMGEPVKIYDLAVNLIKLSGYRPDIDIKIKEIGLRPGEKLYEELLMNEEGLTKTGHNKIFIGKPLGIEYDDVMKKLDILKEALATDDNLAIKEAVAAVVPTYKIDRRCFEEAEEKEPAAVC